MRMHSPPNTADAEVQGTRCRRTGCPMGTMALRSILVLGGFLLLAVAGCRTAGPVVRIEDSPYAVVTVGETMIEAAQGKTVSTDAVNPRIQDNAVPVYSSGSATAQREGDTTDRTNRTDDAAGAAQGQEAEPGEGGGALPGG